MASRPWFGGDLLLTPPYADDTSKSAEWFKREFFSILAIKSPGLIVCAMGPA